ncbi:TetR/AcrR family transcriptional regulator [Rhodococcus pyridinivorans]|uniref:TetR/AcrR family transcriptional regulator n=1 Tax=Rhodococcus pyridinivorans TaxID=103816 RepID=UPI00200A332E|nr:TetR/AcrR family transcriptional regulator [Rhodococcus pyridinivorans]UPW05359.1 TetR/AcrR family transcriptional regulator [Rhodococcus pyridinivorans]
MSEVQQLSERGRRPGVREIESRREQNMRLKRERIFRAASDLLRARGFSEVTTQEVSAAAGVAAGTLFRYAATKSELLLMVYNEALRASIDEGAARAALTPDPAAAVFARLHPLVVAAAREPENSAAYQRELLFGPHDAKFRAEGMALIFELEASLSDTLRRAAPTLSDGEARVTGSSLFAVTHLAIARMTASDIPEADAIDDLRRQVTLIVTGVLHTPRRPDPPPEKE